MLNDDELAACNAAAEKWLTDMPNELANLRRRVNRARKFPGNTCAASRHVQTFAEYILRYGISGMPKADTDATAESMLATVEALWKARTELAKRRGE